MHTLHIKDLEIFANHGVLEEEKKLGQKFVISAELSCDFSEAILHDRVTDTANYAQICQDIQQVMQEKNHDLIETAADQVARHLLTHYHPVVKKAVITLKKPWAPIGLPLECVSVTVSRSWHTAYLGLGSNMGDLFSNLNTAIKWLEQGEGAVSLEKKSGYIQTAPVSPIEQPDYLNCVLSIKTTLSPKELIAYTLNIEAKMGRVREEKWGPRIIDIDILAYDDLVTDDPILTVPHPLMHERMFVLEPFCEIAPLYVHPILNKRMQEIKKALNS